MIIEGIVTTLNERGEVNVAPMGPIVDDQMQQLILRPFRTTTTYANLKQRGCGVFHILDDVLLIAQAALNRLDAVPETKSAEQVAGQVLLACCRWYEFNIVKFDDSTDRTVLTAAVVHSGHLREMGGLNRAKYAVIEATILATRLHLIEASVVREQLKALSVPVEKTAGPRESEAFAVVQAFVEDWYRNPR